MTWGHDECLDTLGLDPTRRAYRTDSMRVPCAWCHAQVGVPCRQLWTGQPLTDERTPGAAHPSRLDTARQVAA